jgi:hypothetical protein
MTPEEEIARGRNAKRVLDDAMYQEAYSIVRERIVSQLSQAETVGEKRDRLNSLLVALSTVQRYMEQVALGGRMAAEQIERDRTMGERIGERLRRAI